MCQSNSKTSINSSRGFTLVEVMIVIAIIGILAAIAAPIMSTFVKKAEYHSLMLTLDQIMDGQDTYYILNDSFYPAPSGGITVNSGQEKDIQELGFNFPSGHKHRYIIRAYVFPPVWNIYVITVDADDDYNGDGRNDRYQILSYFRNGEPLTSGSITYHRYFQQIW